MLRAMSGAQALSNRRSVFSPGTGQQHWGTEYFGPRHAKEIGPEPQSLLTEMSPHEQILAHFHAVNQFHVYAAGSGALGKHPLQPLMIQFMDHHTAYGPLVAGPQGFSFFALRMQTDSGPTYLDRPGYKEKLQPSRRRSPLSVPIVLSTEPVLQHRTELAREALFEVDRYDDGLSAHILRMGTGMQTRGPAPQSTRGYYLFVVNGSMLFAGQELGVWSMVAVGNDEDECRIEAGAMGLEVLLLEYPGSNSL